MEAVAAPKQRTAPRIGAAALAAELRAAVLRAARRLRAEKSDADISDRQYSVLALLSGRVPARRASWPRRAGPAAVDDPHARPP